jgi:hypothetical protein
MKTPDALLLPEAWKKGETQIDRIDSILSIAEPLLNVDRSLGARAYIRRQPGGRLFVSPDPHDTLQFPVGHPREGKPRYHWIARPDGSEHGFLNQEDGYA